MAHQWEIFHPLPYRSTHRRCTACGLVQQFSSASRSRGTSGGWHPNVGKCGLVNLKLKRNDGEYITTDGMFRVWQSPEFERGWYVNLTDEKEDVETLYLGGFRTKWQAVEWLAMNATDYLPEKAV